MKNDIRTVEAINKFKALTENLTEGERETVRDELLAFLLFGEDARRDGFKNRKKSLSEEERKLIKTLAEQTNRLHRTMNGGDQ